MAEPVGAEAYLGQLQALLPQGRAWTRRPDAVLTRLLAAEADELADVDLAATQLLDEIRPDTTFDMLSDWERVVGLPDACSDPDAGIFQRRAAVLERLVAQPTLNPSDYVALGRKFGVGLTVVEHDQVRADAIAGLDTSGGKWVFVWWISIDDDGIQYFDTLSETETPLVEFDRSNELECRLRKAAPAHTHLVIGYTQRLEFVLPQHDTSQHARRIFWRDLADGLADVSALRETAGRRPRRAVPGQREQRGRQQRRRHAHRRGAGRQRRRRRRWAGPLAGVGEAAAPQSRSGRPGCPIW